MIDPRWTTKRLIVSDSVASDIPQLQLVLESIADTLHLEGKRVIEHDDMNRTFLLGDLPPNGQLQRFRLQTISRKDNGDIIGYLTLYHGYPSLDTLYIASLSICKDSQGEGFGGEVVDQIRYLPGLHNYRVHRLVVSVGNWNALRFWTYNGFKEIVRINGNLIAGDGSDAKIELVRRIG